MYIYESIGFAGAVLIFNLSVFSSGLSEQKSISILLYYD